MKMIPSDVEAETYVLGAAMQNEIDLEKVLASMSQEKFFDTKNKVIFGSIKDLDRGGFDVSVNLVAEKIKEQGKSKEITNKYLAAVSLKGFSSDVDYYLKKIEDCYKRRILLSKAGEAVELSCDGKKNVDETIDNLEDVLYSIREEENSIQVSSLGSIADNFFDGNFDEWIKKKYEQAKEFGEVLEGPPTGFGRLDNILGGLAKTRFVVLGAGTGMGKTEILCQFIAKMISKNIPILFFSMEMSKEECFNRLLGIFTSIFHGNLGRGDFSDEELERLTYQAGVFRGGLNNLLHVCDNSLMNTTTMRAIIKRHKKKFGVEVVMVDHLGLLESKQKFNNRYESTSYNSRQMKVLATELGVCMFVAAQINRESFKGEKPRPPRKSDLRDSGNIEQDANQIILLHREQDTMNQFINDRIKLIVAKNRNGICGIVELSFERETQLLSEVDNRDIAMQIKEIAGRA